MKLQLERFFSRSWHALRSVARDDEYDRFVQYLRRRHPESAPPERKAFYRETLDRRWSGICRCC